MKLGEGVVDFVMDFEHLFDDIYGHKTDINATFKTVLKGCPFVQSLVLMWQDKGLPYTK